MHRIVSIDDPRISAYRHLKETNATRRDGLFICEGEKLTRRLLDSEFDVVSLLVCESFAKGYSDVLPSIPIYVVPDESIEEIVGFNFHRGVLACGKRRQPLSLEELCGSLGARCTLAVCPDVQDPENLGTILRIASAFGVNGVLLGQKTADPWSRRVLRVSMGASLRLPIVTSGELRNDLCRLANHWQIERWATVLDADATPLRSVTRPNRLALLFGSEGHGLEREIIDDCDYRVTIPMVPGVDSLNVAVAAGIFFYEATRS